MLIPIHDIVLIYEQMLEELNIDYVSVIIFVSTEADSLCSMKMFSKFLMSENIQYKMYPVGTYTELEQRIQQSKQYDQVKLWMFINCGGSIDLSQKWFLQTKDESQSNKKVILFDVNKPINHKNVQSKDILIIDDGHSGLDKRITSEEIEKLEQFQEMDIDEAILNDDEEEEEEERDGEQPPKRPARILLQQRLKKHKQMIEYKYYAYYKYSFYSLPTSHLLYRMIRELNKANNHTLWYAIVGMTSMYLDNQISRDVLEKLTNYYRSDMIKFNSMSSIKKEKGDIFTKKGFQFPLMNHWSLYDSMMNSPYLMAKLGLWNDKGVKKLHEILSTIGVPIEQAKQQYKYMLKQTKQSLENNLFTVAEDFNLMDMMYESFMRQVDTNSAYMASDYHYLITTLLQKPIHKSTQQELAEHRIHTFLDCYKLLDGSQETIKTALEEFKQTNALVMKQLRDIIERDNIIKMNNQLTITILRCDTKEKRLFEHQNILIRLAYMIMEIQKQKKIASEKASLDLINDKKDKKPKYNFAHIKPIPSIMTFFDNQKGLSLLVGVVPDQKNHLGNKFNIVVQNMKINSYHDKFLSNVIVIPKDSVIEFAKKVADKNLSG